MAQIKKDTSLRKAILQAAITGQLISDIGGESDVLFSNEKKSKTKLDSEADLPLTKTHFCFPLPLLAGHSTLY